MVKIIIHGCGGKMGNVVTQIAKDDPSCEIVAGIDSRDIACEYPVFQRPEACNIDADVIIDFSTAAAIPALLSFAAKKQIPVIVCTTGLSDELNDMLKQTAEKVAVLKSANMSVGINLLMNLVKKAAKILIDSNFDIEIVEKHHNQKIDAPSGTAIALAEAINEVLDPKYEYIYDRSQVKEKRHKNEIGMHAIRGGTIVGDHDIIFAGKDEIITLSHAAMSKEVFAVGAVKAAKYLKGKNPGFYTMKNVME